MEKYKILQQIGGGGYGDVYKARNCETDESVALKVIDQLESQEGIPSSVIREISFLKEMEHSNIVRLLDVVNIGKTVYLVLELMEIDLMKFIAAHPQIAKDPLMIKMFLHQLLSGLAYCHSHKILHRDLKPANLLIDCSTRTLKLADFGSARACGVTSKGYTEGGKVTTQFYRAPELLLGHRNYTTAVDMWSVGCIFAEMLIQEPLFVILSPTDNFLLIRILSILGKPNEEMWPGVTSICDSLRNYAKTQPKILCDLLPGLDTFDKEETKDLALVVPDLEVAGIDLLSNLAVVVPGHEAAGIDLLSKLLCFNPKGRIEAADALNHPYFKDIERP